MHLKASVLINAYNYRRFVGEALASALAQRRTPLEVILVDDGSTDGTAEWVEAEFAARDPRVRVIRQANAGQLSAFCTGVAAAQGDVFFFLDADDTWEPTYLGTVLGRMESYPEIDYIFSGHVRSDGAPPLMQGEQGDRVLGRRSAMAYALGKFPMAMTSAVAMRASLARRFLPLPSAFDPEWKTDADQVLALGAALAGGLCVFISGKEVHYRIHGANHFSGRPGSRDPAVREARRKRAERARLALIERLGLGPDTAAGIFEEFASIERPKLRECRHAMKTALAAPAGFGRRAWFAGFILARFLGLR